MVSCYSIFDLCLLRSWWFFLIMKLKTNQLRQVGAGMAIYQGRSRLGYMGREGTEICFIFSNQFTDSKPVRFKQLKPQNRPQPSSWPWCVRKYNMIDQNVLVKTYDYYDCEDVSCYVEPSQNFVEPCRTQQAILKTLCFAKVSQKLDMMNIHCTRQTG